MQFDDRTLVQGLKNDDKISFEKIYTLFYTRLINFSLEYVVDIEIAREIVQDSFLSLWESRSRLRDDTNISSMLFTITRNNSLNYLKHMIAQRKYNEYEKQRLAQFQLNYIALKDNSSQKIIYKELREGIEAAIDQLPPKCRKIFEMSRMKDLKHKEIASRLNISIKTVDNHISEALKRIRIQVRDLV